jgi:hypothetical protein
MTLPAGERILTDGAHMARTRCGNRLSEVPVEPVLQAEPSPEAMEVPAGAGPLAVPVAPAEIPVATANDSHCCAGNALWVNFHPTYSSNLSAWGIAVSSRYSLSPNAATGHSHAARHCDATGRTNSSSRNSAASTTASTGRYTGTLEPMDANGQPRVHLALQKQESSVTRDFFAETSSNSRVIPFLDKISGPGYATSAKRLS